MKTFCEFVENIAMPKSMGTVSNPNPIVQPEKMQAWQVTFDLPPITTTVTAQSEYEVRRMTWEYLMGKFGRQETGKNGQSRMVSPYGKLITQTVKDAQVSPADNFNWKKFQPAKAPTSPPAPARDASMSDRSSL